MKSIIMTKFSMFKDSYNIKNDNNYWYLNIFSYICIQKSETSTGLQPTLTIFIMRTIFASDYKTIV